MTMKLSRYHVVTEPFIDGVDGRTKRVILATRSAEMRVITQTGWQAIEAAAFEQLPREVLLDLIDIELIVPQKEDELATILKRNSAAALDDDVLYLVIQPTAYCPLGCDYCGQHHSKKWLGVDEQALYIEHVRSKLRAKQFKKLLICWFGAEPLSGLQVIRTLTPQLKATAKNANCAYEAKMVTNGLALTEKIATEVVNEHDVHFIEITIDGIADFHNLRRHRKNGLATFEQIFNNTINLAKRDDLDVGIRVRCNVDRRNYTSVTPLLQKLAEEGVQERIGFYIAPIHSWGNEAHKVSLSREEFAQWEIEWYAQMIKLGFEPVLKPERKPVVCLAVKPHGELIDAEGTLFNCTEVSYVPTYGTPNTYTIGHITTGEIDGKRDLLSGFNERVSRGEYLCSSCRMLPVCGGSCPKQWQEGLIPCPSTKDNIEERLLLIYASSRLSRISPH